MKFAEQQTNVNPTLKLLYFRRSLIKEEALELSDELWTAIILLKCYKQQLTEENREKIIKEMADLLYVLYGFAETFGFDLDQAFLKVHESNLTKIVNSKFNKDKAGKVLKGTSYRAPDLRNIWNLH